ncbi:hypothetical protein CAPTEDRAFT_183814 [Capitella teleta]|uniref:Myeloid leukemia factor n=1 Tax=Capitella teleta TaxID=283909 RepID=R7USN3_CAPTE|nr:hypothetical protein CAPTEDRAFT_183814 [Capitella teleta]|eukprot:ELU09138.1 hypothetical protein CAPTEDRAFT_183814 [Capitella teleta]
MFGGSMFNSGFDDPFFSGHQQHMQQMMGSMGGMGQMMAGPFGRMGGQAAIAEGQQQRGEGQQIAARHQGFADPFGDIFGNMDRMMQGMMGNMSHMMQAPPSSHNGRSQVFSQSSVMTYNNTGSGQPHVYQATSSTHQGPGGVRETRKTVRDSKSGLEKMAVGRHLNDKGVVITRSRNQKTSEREESKDFINLDEEEFDGFNHEWQTRTGGRSRHHVTDGQRFPEPSAPGNAKYRPSAAEGAARKQNKPKLSVDGRKKRVIIKSPKHD